MQRQRRRDELDRLAVLQVEAGPQGFVSANDSIDGLFQDHGVERALHPHGDGAVVKGAARLKLFEEPEPLLCGGNGKGKNIRRWTPRRFIAGHRVSVCFRYRHGELLNHVSPVRRALGVKDGLPDTLHEQPG